MASIFDTIKNWADGQNALNSTLPGRAVELQRVIDCAAGRLSRARSLADLAIDYHAEEGWWTMLAAEFALGSAESDLCRNAAYWQRFMQLRHPQPYSSKQRS